MAIFVPHTNIKSNQSFGQVINKLRKEYIIPELRRRKIDKFKTAGIEIFKNGKHNIYLDNEVQVAIEFKKKKIKPADTGKQINVDLQDIRNLKWWDTGLNKSSAKILIIHFNKNWWIYYADFNKRKDLQEKFKATQIFKTRIAGYAPLNILEQDKSQFLRGWKSGLNQELPQMWKRHLIVEQRYRGIVAYDDNYYDLFLHAQELYVLGYYYPANIICRCAAEQALISILTKIGHGFQIYKRERGKRKLKSIEQLVATCRSYSLFKNKYPIDKTAAKKLNQISTIASQLVHPKQDIGELKKYKKNTLLCMDNLQYVIKNHLNFVKDTGVVSGYKLSDSSPKRLK